jgi:hypothetical protein
VQLQTIQAIFSWDYFTNSLALTLRLGNRGNTAILASMQQKVARWAVPSTLQLL